MASSIHRKQCDVEHCTNTSQNSRVALFSLPKDERKQRWLDAVPLKVSNRVHKFVCSAHFPMECFTDTFKRSLHRTAIPSLEKADENTNSTLQKTTHSRKEKLTNQTTGVPSTWKYFEGVNNIIGELTIKGELKSGSVGDKNVDEENSTISPLSSNSLLYDQVRSMLVSQGESKNGPPYICSIGYAYDSLNDESSNKNNRGKGDVKLGDHGKIKIVVIEDRDQVSKITKELGLRTTMSQKKQIADSEKKTQVLRTPVSVPSNPKCNVEEPSGSFPSTPHSPATAPSLQYQSSYLSQKRARIRQAIQNKRRVANYQYKNETVTKLAQAKLDLALLTKKQTEDEGTYRKKLWELRLKHKKVLLDISELELKRKQKVFEKEFGTQQ